MSREDEVLVIGAGPAGLATSACLHRAGVAHTVVEREVSLAPAWRRHYQRLHLHTVKQHSALPFTPWPADAPTYPSRQAVVDYLERYAAEHGVQPLLGVEVQRVRRVQHDGGGFVVHTSEGEIRPRAVVVATGYNREPFVPELPGLDAFGGTWLHSSRYRDAAPYRGRRTLVVGCGNSGAEIALDLAEQGVEVSMVVRGPVHVAPRDLFGRPAQPTNILLSRLPLALRDAIAVATLKLAVGDLSRWGIVRPALGPNTMIERFGRIPLLDIGTIAMVKQGRIRVVPGVKAITRSGASFDDGSTQPFDAIVFATGYRTGLHTLVEGFDAIADARGRPDRFGRECGIPGLYFVGLRNPPTGALREISLEAPAVAASIAAATAASRPAASTSSTAP